jgi:hypothetical protein
MRATAREGRRARRVVMHSKFRSVRGGMLASLLAQAEDPWGKKDGKGIGCSMASGVTCIGWRHYNLWLSLSLCCVEEQSQVRPWLLVRQLTALTSY